MRWMETHSTLSHGLPVIPEEEYQEFPFLSDDDMWCPLLSPAWRRIAQCQSVQSIRADKVKPTGSGRGTGYNHQGGGFLRSP